MAKKIDGGLRGIFFDRLTSFHWNAIESWSTGAGIPDGEYCSPSGSQAWIEFKQTKAWAVRFKPGQIAWHERRHRMGGRSFIAIRRQNSSRGSKADELYLFRGVDAREVLVKGVHQVKPIGMWSGGPSKWDWPCIQAILGG